MFTDYIRPSIVIPGLACLSPIPYLARHSCGPVDWSACIWLEQTSVVKGLVLLM